MKRNDICLFQIHEYKIIIERITDIAPLLFNFWNYTLMLPATIMFHLSLQSAGHWYIVFIEIKVKYRFPTFVQLLVFVLHKHLREKYASVEVFHISFIMVDSMFNKRPGEIFYSCNTVYLLSLHDVIFYVRKFVNSASVKKVNEMNNDRCEFVYFYDWGYTSRIEPFYLS
jgi:hypothetical protein